MNQHPLKKQRSHVNKYLCLIPGWGFRNGSEMNYRECRNYIETGSKVERISLGKHEEQNKAGQTNWISLQEERDVWRKRTSILNKAARCYLLDKQSPMHTSCHEDV